MNPQHNMQEIILANLVGITMLICILTRKAWKIYRERESKYVLFLVNGILTACILEPLTFYVDGSDKLLFQIINYVSVAILFMLNLAIGTTWFLLVVRHIYNRDYKTLMIIVNSVGVFGVILLIVNLFKPILFGLDENGYYFRGPLYTAYIILIFGYVIAASFFFVLARIRGGQFKYFPAIQFILPIGLGIFIQYHNYGISTMYPSMAVGITLFVFSLQSENIYTDKLLGVKNRFYLDRNWNKLVRKSNFCIMFVDINNFKHINDEFGHAVGDKALKTVATILKEAVGNRGTVIRYAGDEFTLLINSTDEDVAKRVKQRIYDKAAEFNKNGLEAYEITLAVGYHMADLEHEHMFDAMIKADEDMYKDKEKYYETHERRRNE